GRWLAHPSLVGLLRLAGAGLFVLTILAGLLGSENPYQNLAPTLVWIVWWVGLAVFSAFIGDLWALVSPWRTLFAGAERLYLAVTGRAGFAPLLRYPETLGVWPSVLLLFAVSWTELVFPSPAVPANSAWLALLYSV